VRRAAAGWTCALAAVAIALAFGAGGCRTVQGLTTKPKVQSVSATVAAFDLRKMDLRFDVELLNPGEGEMNVAGYEYELRIEGRPFAAGASREAFALAPHGTARVSVPVTIALADLQHALAAIGNRGAASYQLAVTLLIDTPLGSFRFPLTKDGCVSAFPPSARSCERR
jgi:LEA14-like dessication related protein